jgi:hypothetical protein
MSGADTDDMRLSGDFALKTVGCARRDSEVLDPRAEAPTEAPRFMVVLEAAGVDLQRVLGSSETGDENRGNVTRGAVEEVAGRGDGSGSVA